MYAALFPEVNIVEKWIGNYSRVFAVNVQVQVVALPSFEEKAVQFVEEVARLRQRFSHSMAPGGLTSDRWGVVHASGFSINARQIWEHIKEDKDLDLPSLTVMVSTIRCEEIAQDKFRRFLRNEVWRRLEEDARSGPVPNLGSELTAIINACLSGYEKEAIHFNEDVRISWRKQLDEKLLNLVQPAVRSVLGHLSSRTLGMFKQEFDEALSQGEGFYSAARNCFSRVVAHFDIECAAVTIKRANWDVSKEKEELRHNMRTHIGSLKAEKVAKLIHAYKAKLDDMLAGSVEAPLVNANDETWSSVGNLLQRAISSAIDDFTSATHDFEIDEPDKRNMLAELRWHAIGVVETKTRELARKVLILMKERFSILFFPVNNSMRRILTGKENFGTITVAARSASLKLLAVMAAVRLDNKADNMERTLSVALLANHSSTSTIGYGDSTLGSLVSDNWDGIPPSRTLITPIQCESLWRQFIQETKCIVTQAFSVQVKVAEALCEEISNKSFLAFSKDEDWLKLKKAAHKGPVPDFGWKISSMIRACLFRYEMETKNFDKAARRSKQLQLKQNLLHLAQPSFQYVLGRMRCDTLCDFQEAFDKALQNGKGFSSIARDCTGHYMALFDEKCIGARIEQAQWDTSVFSEDLQRDMDAHVASVQDRKVYELVEACKGKLNDALAGPVETLLDGANNETWSSIRKLLHRETNYAVSGFYDALSSFEMDEQARQNMLANLRDHAKRVVEEKAREGAERVLFLMKDRFSRLFFLDDDSMLRAWTGKEDVVAITQGARSASLKSLSVLAAVRLDDVADNIEGTLSASFLYDHCTFSANDTSNSLLASSAPDTWEEVPPTRTLLTPANCEALWKQFIQETENMVARALLSPAGCS